MFRNWLKVALMACAAMGLVVFVQAPAQAVGEVYGPYLLMAVGSDNCIDNPNSSPSDNTTMIIYTCSGKSNQLWSNEPAVTNNDYWTFNSASRKCLTVQNASPSNNAAIIQFSCNSGTNERWVYDRQSADCGEPSCPVGPIVRNGVRFVFDGYFKIRRLNTNFCITVKNASRDSGATLLQFSCSSAGQNVWEQWRRA